MCQFIRFYIKYSSTVKFIIQALKTIFEESKGCFSHFYKMVNSKIIPTNKEQHFYPKSMAHIGER